MQISEDYIKLDALLIKFIKKKLNNYQNKRMAKSTTVVTLGKEKWRTQSWRKIQLNVSCCECSGSWVRWFVLNHLLQHHDFISCPPHPFHGKNTSRRQAQRWLKGWAGSRIVSTQVFYSQGLYTVSSKT